MTMLARTKERVTDGLHKVSRFLNGDKRNSEGMRKTSMNLTLRVVEALLLGILGDREILGQSTLRPTVRQLDRAPVE